ncbi:MULTISPECIES: Uma2 family endonuclease [Nocardia]|uniref:Uma2 family endonuclease n=2 Tax=Nocardia TaxID=1817 RepID=A0A2T2Z3G4_9NOCA|nr:Uma2 family endonuclease [Nocardia elegans]MBF6448947.1 Uma2 family endonuclease [Nocardia elegans]PSR62312.1 Uma2 family endonuclease [Nocardia nova]
MSAEPLPAWVVPPPGGYTADDLDKLPDLPPHTELIDGSLVFVSPQMRFHALVIDLLVSALRSSAPSALRVRREMTVTLGPRQRPEPDLIVVHESADRGADQTTYQPEDVVLAVEVVSPDSIVRDRERKPQLYARAGIPHFWRVENDNGRAVVYIYELDPATGQYTPTGIHHDRLALSVPFELDIDLTEYQRM